MSDDAFAVTPVAAQPPQPNEAVYQALNAALSATARGRWFLSEFAKRNRNSESSKMLDAVARIEQAVADPALAAVSADLLIVRNWAKVARADAAAPMNDPERETTKAAAERGGRIIREIATSMRAVGNDPRICNILDAQLDAIEAVQRASDEPSKNALAAIDRLIGRIEELIPAPPAEPQPPAATELTPLQPALPAPPVDPDARLAAVTDLAVACAAGDPDVAPTPGQLAEDDDLLARIAVEMASVDDGPAEGEMAAVIPADDVDASAMDASPSQIAGEPEPAPASAPSSAIEADSGGLSLGQSVLAQGLVQPPSKPARDPFVALKRLTQSEKIALFT